MRVDIANSRLRVAVLLVWTGIAAAQNPPSPQKPPAQIPAQEPNAGADSNPLQVVLFNIRSEYSNLNDGNWSEAVIARSDKAFLRNKKYGGKRGILTRFDFPIVTVKVASSTHAGLGDLYGQFTYVPFLTRRFAFFLGSGLVLPTATYPTLGFGKWTAAPLGGPAYFFGRKGFAYLKFQEYVSFAGNSSRPDVDYFLVTPTILWRITRKSWVLVDEESHTDFENSSRTWYKAGFQVGRALNTKFGAWIKPEFLWGGSRPGDFNLKFSLVWNR